MNKKYLLAGVLAAGLGIAATANAGAGDVYAGASLGNASPDTSGLDSAVGWKIFAGYEISDILAVEGGYTSFGEMDGPTILGSSTSVEPTGFEVAVVGNSPINSQLSVFGKVGLLAWDFQTNLGVFGSETTTGTDVFYGIGGQYEVSGNLAMRASWERYTIEDGDIDLLSVSAVMEF